jgi:SAM-dependent methyltransferase
VTHARVDDRANAEDLGLEELKQQQARFWELLPFETIAATLVPMHEAIVDAVITPAPSRWLDVGCGTGELSRLAASLGADVTAIDRVASFVQIARKSAEGVSIRHQVADAERLPFEDAAFDIVTSSVAAAFAPDQRAVAHELSRVCAPGGQLVMTAWVETGHCVDLFDVMTQYLTPFPAAAGDPLDWGDEAHVRGLLGERFDLRFTRLDCPLQGESPDALVGRLDAGSGLGATLDSRLGSERVAALRNDLLTTYAEHTTNDGRVDISRPYLLITGRRLGR